MEISFTASIGHSLHSKRSSLTSCIYVHPFILSISSAIESTDCLNNHDTSVWHLLVLATTARICCASCQFFMIVISLSLCMCCYIMVHLISTCSSSLLPISKGVVGLVLSIKSATHTLAPVIRGFHRLPYAIFITSIQVLLMYSSSFLVMGVNEASVAFLDYEDV